VGVEVAFGLLIEESITLLRVGVRQTGGSSEKLKEIVRTVNAESFSITVGSQVSVSVTFRTE